MTLARWWGWLVGHRSRVARVEPKLQPSTQAIAQDLGDKDERPEPGCRLPANRVAGLIERVQWSTDSRR